MRAVQFLAVNHPAISDVPPPRAGPGEALVTVRAAALNHRDLWIKLGQYAGVHYPCIPGSDGSGVVAAVGEGVDPSWVGRAVILNPCIDWGADERAQSSAFSILGLPRAGTLAEKMVVPAAQLSAKPAHLSWVEAAALPLGGLTAYRALFSRARLRKGERLLITGIGGGVALLALAFAVAEQAEVWVTSSSDEKITRAVALGAKGGFNYRRAGWWKDAAKDGRAFDAIIDSAGGDGFEALIELAAPGGRLVFFGATQGNVPVLALRKIFWRQLSLLGTTMGSPADWDAMLASVVRHRLKPVVSDVFPLDQAEAAFDLMERGGQFGKIAVTIGGAEEEP